MTETTVSEKQMEEEEKSDIENMQRITTIEANLASEATTMPTNRNEERIEEHAKVMNDTTLAKPQTNVMETENETTTENEIESNNETTLSDGRLPIAYDKHQDHIQHIYHAHTTTANDIFDKDDKNLTKKQKERERDSFENPKELLVNQISDEIEDDVKDLNNFRHPVTLITASNSDESLKENEEQLSHKQESVNTSVYKNEEEHEDPYHVHILSENHDRLAEHEDYQMLSSTEDSSDTALASSTTTTTTLKTPTTISGIIISEENNATAVPFLPILVEEEKERQYKE